MFNFKMPEQDLAKSCRKHHAGDFYKEWSADLEMTVDFHTFSLMKWIS